MNIHYHGRTRRLIPKWVKVYCFATNRTHQGLSWMGFHIVFSQ